MTRLVRLHANIAGYEAGTTIDLDEIEDVRVHNAIEAGYGERVVLADLSAEEKAQARAEAEAAQDGAQADAEASTASTATKRSSKR